MALFPAGILLAIVFTLLGVQSSKDYVEAILFSMGLVGGALFYVYFALVIYGLPIVFLLKKFGVFNLKMVLTASVAPLILSALLSWDGQIRTLFVIFYGVLTAALGCWFIYKWVYRKSLKLNDESIFK